MWAEPLPNIEAQGKRLAFALAPEAFHFVPVVINRYTAIGQVQDHLGQAFPGRPIVRYRIKPSDDYRSLSNYLNGFVATQPKGILLFENFDELVERPELAEGFNHRRDYLADFPVSILAFVYEHPQGQDPLGRMEDTMRDFFSYRELVVDWRLPAEEAERAGNNLLDIQPPHEQPTETDTKEVERLKRSIATTPPTPENWHVLSAQYKQLFNYKAAVPWQEMEQYAEDYRQYARRVADKAEEARALIEQAESHSIGKNYAKAKALFTQAEVVLNALGGISPATRDLYYNLYNRWCNLCLVCGWDEEGKAIAQKALNELGDVAVFYNWLGLFELTLGNYSTSLEVLEQSLAMEPDKMLRYLNVADVLIWQRKYKQAKEVLLQAENKKVDPSGGMSWFFSTWARIERGLNNLAEAKQYCYQAIEHGSISILGALGSIHLHLGEVQEAEVYFQKSVAHYPQFHDAWGGLGQIYLQTQRWDKAIDALRSAIDLYSPGLLVDIHAGKDISYLKKQIEVDRFPLNRTLLDLSMALAATNDYKFSLAALGAAISLKPALKYDVEALGVKGDSLAGLNRFEEALEVYREASFRYPDLLLFKRNELVVLMQMENYGEAFAEAEAALKKWPDYAEFYVIKGHILYNTDKEGEALACFEQALQLEPGNIKALDAKGACLLNAGEYQAAEAAFKSLLELGEKDAKLRGLNRLLALYDTTGEAQKKAEVAKQLAQLESS